MSTVSGESATGGARVAGARSRRRIRVAIAAGAVAFAALAPFALNAFRGGHPPVPAIVLLTQVQGPGADRLAQDLGTDVARLAAEHAGEMALLIPIRAPAADYVLRVRGTGLRARVTLAARGGAAPLWSAAFGRAAGGNLREPIAAHLSEVLPCMLRGAAAGLDPATLRLFLQFCAGRGGGPAAGQLALARRLVRSAPGFARFWADLALVEAETGGNEAAARRHLLRARRMDASLGETWLAEALLAAGPARRAERMDILDRGIADTGYAPLYHHRAIALMRVGRIRDAVDSAQRAAVLDPLSRPNRELQIRTLAWADDIDGARAALEAAERTWPDSAEVRGMRLRFDLRYGDAAHALWMLDDPGQCRARGLRRQSRRPARLRPRAARADAGERRGRGAGHSPPARGRRRARSLLSRDARLFRPPRRRLSRADGAGGGGFRHGAPVRPGDAQPAPQSGFPGAGEAFRAGRLLARQRPLARFLHRRQPAL
ncbi:MAG: hypothetical protein WDN24_00780 [Sphingomonas sp.]